ncbi:MAG: GTP cyclohydrolase I, partial [Candidatus Paceibacterota bacterium]
NEIVSPKGAAIRISALHSCEGVRGVMQSGVPTVTVEYSGAFKEDKIQAEQFLQLLNTAK